MNGLERLLLAALITSLVIMGAASQSPKRVHASEKFEEKFYLSRGCPGYWSVDNVNQEENSVIMRCEE